MGAYKYHEMTHRLSTHILLQIVHIRQKLVHNKLELCISTQELQKWLCVALLLPPSSWLWLWWWGNQRKGHELAASIAASPNALPSATRKLRPLAAAPVVRMKGKCKFNCGMGCNASCPTCDCGGECDRHCSSTPDPTYTACKSTVFAGCKDSCVKGCKGEKVNI
jgi:hypothetical protein